MVALLTADSFNRADNASSLGSTDGAGTLDPVAWTADVGTWGISSNAAYNPSGTAVAVATIDVGHANVDVRAKLGSSGGDSGDYYGVLLRYIDANNYIRVDRTQVGDALEIVKRVSGVNTTLISFSPTWGAGVVQVTAINNVITVYLNGTAVARVIDSAGRSATKCGMICNLNGAFQIDDFSVRTVVVPNELSTDSFNRLDSTLLGNTNGSGSLDPLTWDALSGSSFISDIVSNEANVGSSATIGVGPTGTGTHNGNTDFLTIGQSDVTLHMTVPTTGGAMFVGLVFRMVDSSNYWAFIATAATNTKLYKKVGGTWTAVSGALAAVTSGGTLSVHASGSTIICEVNGLVVFTVSDSDLKTATKHGITLDNNLGSRVDNFQVWEGDPAIPVINEVGPTTGPTGGGTVVTITGNNFTGATDVKFGSLSATSFTVHSDTYITATTPAHSAALVHTIVTNVDGDSVLEIDDQFTFATPSPIVSSVTPSHGPPAGGTSVVLTGAYFTGATSVKFDTTEAGSFTVDNDGQITATTPAHIAGVTPVIVTTPYGTNG